MKQSRWQERGRQQAYSAPVPSSHPSILKRPIVLILLTLILIGFGFFLWWGYQAFFRDQNVGDLPTIYGEEGPYKVRPEDPHTHKIPHKEKTIYEHISREKSQKKEVTLRGLPEDPKEQGPTLPADFIEAFSDQSPSGESLLTHDEGPQEGGQDPPFFEGEGAFLPSQIRDVSPLAERDGFFEDGANPYDKDQEIGSPRGEGSPLLTAENLAYPEAVSCLQGVTCPATTSSTGLMCLELCQVESEQKARHLWRSFQKQAPDLLAAQKVFFRKIDHGRLKGVRYHVTVTKLPADQAKVLQEKLRERGLKTSLFPS